MNEAAISDALYNDVIDYLAEELCSSWHPEKPDGCQLALNPDYEHEKCLEHYGKYTGGGRCAQHHIRRYDSRHRSRRVGSC